METIVTGSSGTASDQLSATLDPISLGVEELEWRAEPRFWSGNKLRVLSVVGALAIVGSQDRALKGGVPEFFSNTLGDFGGKEFGERGTPLERMGRMPGAAQLAGGFYLTGALTGSVRARKVGVLALEAKIVNDLVTTGLKMTIGRERPGSGSDGDEFDPLGGDTAFPSGHTASAFALATVVADNYESKWVKFTSYGLATLVGVGRINQGAHWASDVAGGALVGYGVGKLISDFERRKGWSRALYFEGNGVSIKKKFQ